MSQDQSYEIRVEKLLVTIERLAEERDQLRGVARLTGIERDVALEKLEKVREIVNPAPGDVTMEDE